MAPKRRAQDDGQSSPPSKKRAPGSPDELTTSDSEQSQTSSLDRAYNEAQDSDSKPPTKKKVAGPFQCRGFVGCDLSFTRSEHLARHIRKHTGERPYECHCRRRFSRLDNLHQHAATVHANEEIPLDSLAHPNNSRSHRRPRRTGRQRAEERNGQATSGQSSQSSVVVTGDVLAVPPACQRPLPMEFAVREARQTPNAYHVPQERPTNFGAPLPFSFEPPIGSPAWPSSASSVAPSVDANFRQNTLHHHYQDHSPQQQQQQSQQYYSHHPHPHQPLYPAASGEGEGSYYHSSPPTQSTQPGAWGFPQPDEASSASLHRRTLSDDRLYRHAAYDMRGLCHGYDHHDAYTGPWTHQTSHERHRSEPEVPLRLPGIEAFDQAAVDGHHDRQQQQSSSFHPPQPNHPKSFQPLASASVSSVQWNILCRPPPRRSHATGWTDTLARRPAASYAPPRPEQQQHPERQLVRDEPSPYSPEAHSSLYNSNLIMNQPVDRSTWPPLISQCRESADGGRDQDHDNDDRLDGLLLLAAAAHRECERERQHQQENLEN